jgi:hypothetical protein
VICKKCGSKSLYFEDDFCDLCDIKQWENKVKKTITELIGTRMSCYTSLQKKMVIIADDIIAEGYNHIWVVIEGIDYFVYDDGEIRGVRDEIN